MKTFQKQLIAEDAPVRVAMKQLDELGAQLTLTLFVVDAQDRLKGTLTDGDVRRGLLEGLALDTPVTDFMNTEFRYMRHGVYDLQLLDRLRKENINMVPILDEHMEVKNILNLRINKSFLPLEAVIMAGGRGARLSPLTDTVPKPLLPVGEKSIIEHNVDRLVDFGVQDIHLTLFYKAQMLIDAFESRPKRNGEQIHFITEKEPLGTFSSVGMINDFKQDHILVMNSDLLTNIDLEAFYRACIEQDADLGVASVNYDVNIPYAILEQDGNQIRSLREKPTLTYQANAGIYIVKKEMLSLVTGSKYFNATDFMEEVINAGRKVINFPIYGYWLDIGRHEDYQKAQRDIEHIRF